MFSHFNSDLRSTFIFHLHINLWEEARRVSGSFTCGQSHVVIYKGKVRRTWRTIGLIHEKYLLIEIFASFGRTPASGMKAAQCFIHEAPGILC